MGLVTPVGISGRTLGSVSESGFEEGSQQRHKKRYFFDFSFIFFLQIFANFCKFLMFLRYFSRFRYWGCLDNNLFIAASWWKGCAILYQKVSVNSYFSLITSGLKIRIMGIPTYEAKYKKVRSVYLEAKQNNLSWQTRG